MLGGLIAELLDISAWVAPKIIHKAAARISNRELRERYEEEWLAELSSFDGLKLVKLLKAIGIWKGSHLLARQVSNERTITVRETFKVITWTFSSLHSTKLTKGISHETLLGICIISILYRVKVGHLLPAKDFQEATKGAKLNSPRTVSYAFLHTPLWVITVMIMGVIVALKTGESFRRKMSILTYVIKRAYVASKNIEHSSWGS